MTPLTLTKFLLDKPRDKTESQYALELINELAQIVENKTKAIDTLEKVVCAGNPITEQIVVRIGVSKRHLPKEHSTCNWLINTLGITKERATVISNILRTETENNSNYAEVVMSHKQLARYTALRRTDGVSDYYKYPHVISYIPDSIGFLKTQPIEIRPGRYQENS